MIIDGLRPRSGRPAGSNFQETGSDGDVEGDLPGPRARNSRGPTRRSQRENLLSVSVGSSVFEQQAYNQIAEDPQVYAGPSQGQLDEKYCH